MQRYNPIYEAVNSLIRSAILGDVLHGYFENYASDENLPHHHWFWDRAKSGGIFIEHGVHFFDMFAGWLGSGTVVAAQRGIRPGSIPTIEEHVQCTVRYDPTILVNFYHGFHQAGRMDRQELRLVFEWGDVTLLRLGADASANSRDCRRGSDTRPVRSLSGRTAGCHGQRIRPRIAPVMARGKHLDVYQTIELSYGDGHQQVGSIRRSAQGLHDRPDRLDSGSFPRSENH